MKDLAYDEFVNHVRDALAHLYDYVHLQSHPLANLMVSPGGIDGVTRAQKLRRLLIEAIEQLSPAAGKTTSPDASCGYSVLCYRYIDGLSPEEIASTLAISPRQVYRKLREGVEAVASLLWDRLGIGVPAKEAEPAIISDRRSLAQATVQHLGARSHPETLEIGTVLESIIRDLQPYCERIGAEIFLLPSPMPLHVHADRTMLRQALINLLTNSLDRATSRVLTIELTQSHSQLQLTLRAQPEDGQSDLSLPLMEREGIGWEVAVKLIEMQGGQVTQKDDDESWCVQVRLPRAGPHCVLIIDDMTDLISLFQRFTTRYMLEVIGAENASQAFEMLENLTPSLILLDVMLPRQDGWEVLQRLKTNPATAHIPVIICSILNEPGLAAALGANGYLRKPVTQDALLQELSRWLNLVPGPAAAPW
jgi:CheY-like chemotaxis protein/two-component sensor histidine kinase